jgi:AcrR family transcriptional regulator
MTKELKPTDTLNKLIEVAIDLFSITGFSGTSVRDIAKKMNMSMGAIYNYFPSKEDLFFFIFEKTVREAKEKVFAVAEMDLLPPMERFKLMLRAHFTAIGTHLKESRITFLEDEYFSPENKMKNREEQKEFMQVYVKEIKMLQDTGCINPSTPATILAFNIFATINWFMRWYKPEGSLPLEQVIEHVINFIVYGIKGQPDQVPKGDDKPR